MTLADLTEKASICPTCWNPTVRCEEPQPYEQRFSPWQVNKSAPEWHSSDMASLRAAIKLYISALKRASQDIARRARSWRMSIQVYDFAAKVGLTEADLLKAGGLVAEAFGIDGFPDAIPDCDPEYPEDPYIMLAVETGEKSAAELAQSRTKALSSLRKAFPPSKWQRFRVVLE